MQTQVPLICEIFGLFLVNLCTPNDERVTNKYKRNTDKFEVDYQWDYINYTWPTPEDYTNAVDTEKYIPENNVMAGIKIYKDYLYIALPKIRTGAPITLAVIPRNSKYKDNVLLRPFPNWRMHTGSNCATLQNVQSMEIDSRGVMWVLDGNRFNNFTQCPPKLVLLDLKNRGKVVHIYEFSNDICSKDGGFLNDIVIDESDGGFAYITENSAHDPGIIIYSRSNNKAWKIRDKSMFAEMEASNFSVDGLINDKLVPVDGIALSPNPNRKNEDRLVYYCALSGYQLYAISNRILKNEQFCKTGAWRRFIKAVGKKQGQSDGLAMDHEGNLYYGLLNMYGVGKWNIYEPFNNSKIIDQNNSTMIWPDSFSFDGQGFLYVLSNGIHKYFNPDYDLKSDNGTKFRVMKIYTGTKSYLT